ncbi:B12-binding domain-containing radical SAM protein [Stigmatella aurantiaca]|uniref:B12-binding domain-containing radical SAM protein n=1 Tax=Stigmatella aurantiaca TaxID=41 RepID=UPI001E304E6D|nr:radical SAM protein [Stigmatella aurantiaca]
MALTTQIRLDVQAFKERESRRRPVFVLALDWTRAKDPRVPLGHASLVASLRAAAGIEVSHRSFHLNSADFQLESVVEAVLDWDRGTRGQSGDLGIGVYIWNEHLVHCLLGELRRRGFSGRIVLGGPQISYAPAGVEQLYPEADCFIRGYGETAFAAVVATREQITHPGVTWRGQAEATSRAEADLASLPSPLLTGLIPSEGQRYLRWETQRGCPYRCTFCQHRESGARLRNTRFPMQRLREEIALFARAGTQEIDVLDPIFNLGQEPLLVLEELVRQRIQARISLQCRFELLKPEFLELCTQLNVFPEFGLQTIHTEEGRLVQRQNDMTRVETAMGELARRGIAYMVTLIYGLPGQTLESFHATVEFCLKRGVHVVRAFPLNLLRGTELERDKARWGLVESDDPIPMVIRSNSFDEADWHQMRGLAALLSKTEGHHPASVAQLLHQKLNAA